MGGQGIVREMVQNLKEIVNFSDSEIYTMLVECNMDPNQTVMSLISQDAFQEVKSKRNKKKNTNDQADSSRRRIPNNYKTARGGGSETRLAQSEPANRRGNHFAGSSSAPNSDPKNAEVKKAAPTGSTGPATSSSVPEPAYQSAWVKANPGKKTIAEIVKMGKPLHQMKVIVPPSSETQESGSKAPFKDEGSSLEKQEVTDPVSSFLKPSAESKTDADQVSEPQHVDDEVPEMKTNPVASHPDVDQAAQCSYLRFGSFDVRIGSDQASSGFNYNLVYTQEKEKESSFSYLYNNFYGEEEEEEALGDNVATDERKSYQIDSTARNYHASSDSDREAAQHEPPQEDPQMQNLDNLFTNVMDLRDASISPPGAGQQATALYQHAALSAYYHQHGMPLGHHGNFISNPFMPHGYMHSDFQQGFLVGNHQAPVVVVLPPSASSFLQQNENTVDWRQIRRPNLRVAPRREVYILRGHPSQQPPGFVQAQQLHQQQLSQLAAMSLDQLNHYHQQSAGEASK
ncbi:unnamed protein product [Eruca vesicaria subsp. sativa]|uniref:GBF-interacting protein 1 N-terminal domain-containing protein n=1 Tax=Eruca vesicaria subsp. sativa TaxID=29727 RepID=A0ABC8KHG4_ERUVS|nr:unnamed protein product [Eruca vesicaria subsp. sativa]